MTRKHRNMQVESSKYEISTGDGKHKLIIRHVVRHSVRVAASAGLWYAATFIHDSPMMLAVMIAGILIQTIVEEIFKES